MANYILSSDMRRYALAGAQARLAEISLELKAIRRAFPELRTNDDPARRQPSVTKETAGRRGRRRTMSAAERNAVSERMKRYWAARRGGSERAESTSSDSPAKTAKAARGAAKRRPRTMSPDARKRISDAQKARWAKQRGATVATGSESVKTSAKSRRGTAKRSSRGPAKRGARKLSAAARMRMSEAQKKRWAAKRASH